MSYFLQVNEGAEAGSKLHLVHARSDADLEDKQRWLKEFNSWGKERPRPDAHVH